MWARTAEVMLGCWLVISPFIFGHPPEAGSWWVNDIACGTIVIVLSLLSFWELPYWRFLRRARFLILAVALWMAAFAYAAAGSPAAPALQNNLVVALLLLMFALVPTEADLPPEEWRKFLARELEQDG